MKKSFHSVACAATIATTMLLQIFAPSVVLAIDTTEDTEPSTTIETTVTSETSIETSADVIEPSDTTSDSTDYTEVTEDLTETEADVTEVTEEEVISSETNTDPTAVTETEETVETLETEETVETLETEETVETLETEEIEYVVFDHYYSDIDSSLVNTTELFVITSDSSVFTRNTNVVSNYDDAFIIECASVEEARFVYSYYVDKVEFITDLSAVASVASPDDAEETEETVPVESELSESSEIEEPAETTEVIEPIESQTEETLEATVTETSETSETILEDVDIAEPTEAEVQEPDLADLSDLNNGSDAISNLNGIDTVHNDYSGYIALIDTGANAHANFTVLGGDTFDHNGHGTSMFGYIRSENPSAQVVSIKVSENGSASAADIYAGFRLAIDLNVSVINFSMTAPDTAKNDVIRDIIQEALDAGIVVIGAAGNNSISATHFIPGCIDGVITVGAVTMGGTRYSSSNYDADYYVIAESTSEATARFSGIYTSDRVDEEIALYTLFTEFEASEYSYAYLLADDMTNEAQANGYMIYYSVVINEDGTVSFVPERVSDEFLAASNATEVQWATINYTGSIPAGTYTGTCTTSVAPGNSWPNTPRAYATGFTGDNDFSRVANTLGNVPIVCSKAFDGAYYGESWASNMAIGTCNYQAVVDSSGNVTLYVASGRDASINCGMGMSASERTATYTYDIKPVGGSSVEYTITVTGTNPITGAPDNYSTTASTLSELANKVNAHYSAKVSLDLLDVGSFTIEHFGSQRYQGLMTPLPISGAVRIGKVNGSGQFLPGATLTITGSFDDEARVRGASGTPTRSGNSFTFVTGAGEVTIEGLMPNSNYVFAEIGAPSGFSIATPDRVTFSTDGNGNPTGSSTGQWTWNADSYTYTLTNERTGGLVFNKVRESGSGDVAGAGIFFAAATTNTAPNPFGGVTVSAGATWYSAGSTITMPDGSPYTAPADGYYFVTNGSGDDFSANNVVAGATYVFSEIYVPNGYGKAQDIIVTVDAQGNISPNSGAITMLEPGTSPHGSLAIVKTLDSTDEFGFLSAIYTRSDSAFTWGWPVIDRGANGLTFGCYYYGADASQAAGMYNGIYSFGAGTIADGRLGPISGNTARVLWAPGSDYSSYADSLTTRALPFRWIASSGEATWELNNYQTDTLGYLAPGYYLVTEQWRTGVFGAFQGDANAEALYIASMNAGGWHCVYNTGLSQKWDMMYHVTPQGTFRCQVGSGTSGITHTGTLEHREGDNYNELDGGRDMRYAQPSYVDYTTCVNENSGTTFDLTKVDESGVGVDGVSFALWHNNQAVALGVITNPNNPDTSSGSDTYNVSWAYQLNYPQEVYVGDYPFRSQVINFAEVYAPTREYATWIVRNNSYRDNGGVWGEAPDDYPINPSYEVPNTPIYWQPDEWIHESHARNIADCRAYYGENGSNGGLGNSSHYAGTSDRIMNLPLGDYQIREYFDPAINVFKTPDGWSGPVTDSTGTYFYKNVSIGDLYDGIAYNETVVNEVLGRIDVTKVNLTGGPLTDLSFEILNSSNTVVATGYIPANTAPSTTGTETASDYTYSATWDYTINGNTLTGRREAVTGLGTFTVREYIPVSAFAERDYLTVNGGWTYGGVIAHNGVNCYYFNKTVVIDNNNAADVQAVAITNEVHPTIGTTLTDFANRHITVVGENIEFTDVVAYEGAYAGGSYVMHATLMDAASGQPVRDVNGNVYEGEVPFTASSTGSGTVNVTFTVNTADLVEATQDARGVVTYSPRSIVCFESMRLVGGYEIANHNDLTDENQTVEIPNPEIGTTFYDLQTEEHVVPAGRIVEVVDRCSYTGLHAGETYTLTCFLYDQTTGEQLKYSDGTYVTGTREFVPQNESGTVDVTFTIDTSDLIVNVFQYEERTIVAFEYLRTESGILIGGHTDIDDLAQHNRVPAPTVPRSLLLDDQTGTHEGVIGAAVTMTDTLWFEGLNIGESYQIRGSIVDRENPNIVYATVVHDFVAQARNDSVQVQYTVDTSMVCEGNREAYLICFEQLWQLDTQNTGRGEVLLARHEDVRDQDQSIHLVPEIHTTMNDVVTNSHYGMIGEDVVLEDTVAFFNLHIGESYTVTGVLMDKQTGLPVMQNGQPVTSQTTFVAPTQDGTVVVTYHVNTLELINQIGQTVNGITITAPREVVSFETITSTSNYDFAIHSDINDQGQTIICGDISSGAGDTQTSTSWLASGLTTVHDNVHYRGLGPVEYTLRGSLHLVDYDENGNPIDGGLIQARPGEVVELEHTWTPSNHEGDVGFDFKLDSDRFQGRNIVVFEELWYNGVCIISHENYSDSMGNYGMANTEQTVHVASVWTSAFSFQSGEQLLAYDTEAKVTDFVYYGNVEVGQDYYCEASLWACYTDEQGQIHSVAISQADGGVATSPVFRATENHGIAEVTFTIDSTKLFDEHYDYLLVTERLVHVGSGVCIATHSDLTSKEQSINIPDLHTTASTATGNTLPEGENPDIMPVTVTDRVYYENLICDGRYYTIVGNLQYARTDADGNITESGPLMQNGQPVTATKTFVPTEPTGYIDLEFTVNAADIMAHGYNRIVVFEDLYFGPEGIRVGVHADINDEEQTIYVPPVNTPTPTPPETPPKTGDESGYSDYMFGAVMAVVMLAGGIVLLAVLDRKNTGDSDKDDEK